MNLPRVSVLAAVALIGAWSCAGTALGDPPVTAGLQLWLDASQQNTVVAADGVLDDGDRVLAWDDILVGGNLSADNAGQTEPNAQPVWIESVPALNGHAVVRFDGIRTYLSMHSLTIGASSTIFLLAQNAIQSADAGSWHRPILAADNDPFRGTGNGYGISYSRAGVPESVFACLGDGSNLDAVEVPLVQDYAYGILIVRRNGAATDGTELYKRGLGDPCAVLLGTQTFSRTGGLHTGYDLGANPPVHNGESVRFYCGDVAEVIIYDRCLSDSEMEQVSDYIAEKYLQPHACGHPLAEYKPGDLNHDCRVNLLDYALLAQSWFACTRWDEPACAPWLPESAAQRRWNNWRRSWDTFPIAAWSYFMRYGGTDAEYSMYEGADLTMVQAPIGGQFNSAGAAGLRVLIGSWQGLYNNETKLQYYVSYPTPSDAGVCGYLLMDEPDDAATMRLLADATEYIYYHDQRGAIPIVNLKPSYGSYSFPDYDSYVSSYIKIVKPAVLLYDHYPLLDDGTDTATFYSDMETIRQEALNAGIGFMGFALVNGYAGHRQPSESDLRWQVYSLITYGAQGMWYYNYRIKPTGGFGEGLVDDADGNPTATYNLVQPLNAELQVLGPTLLQLTSRGVYHTGSSVPPGTTSYSNGVIAVLADFTGDDFLLGEFENGDVAGDNDTYLMVTNKRHAADKTSAQEAADATFTVSPASLSVYRYDPGTGAQQLLTGSGGTYTIHVGGGQGVLLRVAEN